MASATNLTPKEAKFVALVFADNDKDNTECYLEAFPKSAKWKRKTCSERASRLLATNKAQTRLRELRDAAAADAIASKSEVLAVMTEIMRNNTVVRVVTINKETGEEEVSVIQAPAKDSDRIKAGERISKINGYDAAKVLSFDTNNTAPMEKLMGKED